MTCSLWPNHNHFPPQHTHLSASSLFLKLTRGWTSSCNQSWDSVPHTSSSTVSSPSSLFRSPSSSFGDGFASASSAPTNSIDSSGPPRRQMISQIPTARVWFVIRLTDMQIGMR
jgi:hypothetical protein